jgi:chaperonin cofactor prefoldin
MVFITDSKQMINSMILCLRKLQYLGQKEAEEKIVQYIENLRSLEKEPLGKAYALSQLKPEVEATAKNISTDPTTIKTSIEDLHQIVEIIKQIDNSTTKRLNKISETLEKLSSIVEDKKDIVNVLNEIKKLSEELGMKDTKSQIDDMNKAIKQNGTADVTKVTKEVCERVIGVVISTIDEQIDKTAQTFVPTPPLEKKDGVSSPKTKQVKQFKTYVSIADDSGHKRLYECSNCHTSGKCDECREVEENFSDIKPNTASILKNVNIKITTTQGREIMYKCECINGQCEKCDKEESPSESTALPIDKDKDGNDDGKH